MTREQRRLVETMRSMTFDFSALARSRDEFGGGMQWLKVKKWEYLTRLGGIPSPATRRRLRLAGDRPRPRGSTIASSQGELISIGRWTRSGRNWPNRPGWQRRSGSRAHLRRLVT